MMGTLIIVLVLALFAMQTPATNVLENESVRMEVSTQNGSIVHLVDKKTRTDYINEQTHARLFRLVLPNPDQTARHSYGDTLREINSHDQTAVSVGVEDNVMKIRFRGLREAARRYGYMIVKSMEVDPLLYDMDATVTLRLDGSHIHAGLQVENRSPEEIADVTFPWLGGLVRTADAQPARVVLPSLSQKVLTGTAAILGGERAKAYPGLLAASWVNYEFTGKGIGIEAQSEPEVQSALVSLAGPSGAHIGWTFFPHISGQNRWVSPNVVLHIHDSDWHTIAGEHREWLRQQLSPTRANAFDRAIGFATYRLKKDDNTVNWTYDQIPKLAEEARSAGMQHLVIDGWREREGPANPCPFGEIADSRMGGGARLKAVIERLHSQGIELVFAFHPSLVNTATEQYAKEAHGWTIKSSVQGNQVSNSYVFITQDYPYEYYNANYRAQIDPASPATDYLLREARRLKEEYGFRHLWLKGVGLSSFLSYNKETAVPPQRAYVVGYDRFLGGLRKLLPEGLLLTEGLNDLVNRYGSAGYTWSQANAEILALSLPWAPFSNDVEALDYDQANASFARKVLINLIVDGGDGTVGRYAEFGQHLKALQGLKQATVPYYSDAEFRDHEAIGNVVAHSGIMISTFHNRGSRQVGIVVANLANEKKQASFELAGEFLSGRGRLFRMSGEQNEVSLSSKVILDLTPYEITILAIDPKR